MKNEGARFVYARSLTAAEQQFHFQPASLLAKEISLPRSGNITRDASIPAQAHFTRILSRAIQSALYPCQPHKRVLLHGTDAFPF